MFVFLLLPSFYHPSFFFLYFSLFLLFSSTASLSAGSGPTSLYDPTIHVPMLPLATMMATLWCPSCLFIEMENISCPTRFWDMNMPIFWTLVSTEQQTCPVNMFCFYNFLRTNRLILSVSTTGQRFMQEFLTPYLEQAQQIWQWLLGAGILGALIAAVFAALVVVARRKWKRNQRRKKVSSYGERQPLLNSSSEEGSASYQTTL